MQSGLDRPKSGRGDRRSFRPVEGIWRCYRPQKSGDRFWKEPAPEPSAELTDVSRSGEYCERFKLLPSNNPYVLVTTRHPGAQEVRDYFFASLNGLDPGDSSELLAKLTDQLLVTGLDQAGPGRQYEMAAIPYGCTSRREQRRILLDQVSFTSNTGFFKAEIAHSSR